MEQVSHGAEERCSVDGSPARHGLPTWEIGPVGRHQRTRAVRQDQDQAQPTLSVESAEDFERLPFKWMMSPNDPDEPWHLDVGSVCRLPSIASSTRRCSRVCLYSPPRSDAGSKPAWSSSARWTRRQWARRKAASSRPCSPISRSTAWSGCSARSVRTAARSPPPAAGSNRGINPVRYADDFVVTAPSREVLEGYVIPRLDGSSPPRAGASQAKTRIVHVDDGFDFLGFNLRHFPNGKLLARPQKEKVALHRRRLSAFFRPTGRCRRPR